MLCIKQPKKDANNDDKDKTVYISASELNWKIRMYNYNVGTTNQKYTNKTTL